MSPAQVADVLSGIEKADAPLVGLGEASPPSPLQAGWKTNFARRLVPLSEFQSGGPGKDGIPSIDAPRFAPASEIRFLRSPEPVIELTVGKTVRGYPIQILIWHEIANDTVAGVPVALRHPGGKGSARLERGVRGAQGGERAGVLRDREGARALLRA